MATGSGENRVLALDVGKVRVGVAISDPLGLTAQPLPTLSRKPDSQFFEQLALLIEEYAVATIVFGLPIGLRGQKGESYREVESLIEQAKERWPSIGLETVDERFTSKLAQEVGKHAPRQRKKKKGLTDQIAAQLILQDYLQRNT